MPSEKSKSTVTNDVVRAANIKDQKFIERWSRVREFAQSHPSVKPRGERGEKPHQNGNTYGGRTYRERNPRR